MWLIKGKLNNNYNYFMEWQDKLLIIDMHGNAKIQIERHTGSTNKKHSRI